MASIKEVAAEAQVSLGTVSKVLNARGDSYISPATRARVFAAAQRVGYHPSVVARGLAGKRMDAIGVIMAYDQVSVTSDSYLGPCLDGILHISKLRRQKTIFFLEDSWEEAIRHVPVYCDGHCDGLLLVIPRIDSEIISILQNRPRPIPFVLVGDSREDASLVSVDMDNVLAGRQATEYLIGLGHRRIAAFCGNADFCSNTQRLTGYRAALSAAGLPVLEEWIFPGEYRHWHGEENMRRLLQKSATVAPAEQPTAIFCFSDTIALGALKALTERGLHAPDDISIIGVDDIPAAATNEPALTTVRQPIRRVGERATETLLDAIHHSIEPGLRALVSGEIQVRDTAGPGPFSLIK